MLRLSPLSTTISIQVEEVESQLDIKVSMQGRGHVVVLIKRSIADDDKLLKLTYCWTLLPSQSNLRAL